MSINNCLIHSNKLFPQLLIMNSCVSIDSEQITDLTHNGITAKWNGRHRKDELCKLLQKMICV